jgi:thymidylate synthase (FAD)
LLARGVAKEQARAVLPVGLYSQMIWSCNPRSLMHFLSLRNAPTALKEIRELAEQAEEVFGRLLPITHAAFVIAGRVAP